MTTDAWAAGLFEGEGCITIYRKSLADGGTGGYPSLSLAMVDEDVVRRFAEWAGCGGVNIRRLRPPQHRDQWTWHAARRDDVHRVMERIAPFLGERRLARWAEVSAIESVAIRRPRTPRRAIVDLLSPHQEEDHEPES